MWRRPMSPLKIALACDWFPPRIGGVERHVWGLSEALAARGHVVHVYTTTRNAISPHGVTIHHLDLRCLPGLDVVAPVPWYFAFGRGLLDGKGFDVVHGHGSFSSLAIGLQYVAGQLGIPSVMTAHSLMRPAVRAAGRLITAVYRRRVTAVTAVSGAVAADTRRMLRRDDVAVVPNGIDLPYWTRPTGRDGSSHRLTAVTRLVPKKHPIGLVRAAARIFADVPGAHLTIGGSGSELEKLQREIAGRNLHDRIEIRRVDGPDAVRALVAGSVAFLSTCRTEGFGLAALEARALGVPVVAFDAGGIREVVEHGVTGLLAANEDEFVAHVVHLARDDERRSRMARAARAGLERFDWPAVVDRYLELYEAVIVRSSESARRARLVEAAS